jgi:Rod binding domain-containing protein
MRIDSAITPSALSHPPHQIRDAAQQFEALILAQLLANARADSESDSCSDTMRDFAEQQVAAMLSASGGLGLARLIERGLSPAQGPASPDDAIPGK